MARRKKKNGESPHDAADKELGKDGTAPMHNVGMRKDIMRDCAESMRRIILARAELNEEAKDIRKRLRDCDINVKAWEAALRLSDMEDIEARDSYLDGLREAFEAIGSGQMVDMFAGMEGGQPADTAKDFEETAGQPEPDHEVTDAAAQ